MGNWGVSSSASHKEKIKSEYADYLNGLNCVGKISYEVYSEEFDFDMELLDRMFELGKKAGNFDFSRVKKALEIQTPKIIKIKRWCPAYCPNCESELSEHHGDGYYTYPTYRDMCPKCGQKIQWDESEA